MCYNLGHNHFYSNVPIPDEQLETDWGAGEIAPWVRMFFESLVTWVESLRPTSRKMGKRTPHIRFLTSTGTLQHVHNNKNVGTQRNSTVVKSTHYSCRRPTFGHSCLLTPALRGPKAPHSCAHKHKHAHIHIT